MWYRTSLNLGEKIKIPKSLLPRHWDAGLYHPMSMLPTVGGHKVLGKGTWWTAGITVLCCISPTGLGFVVQASRSLFAQLETCCSQHDSSIYNVLLPERLVALVRCFSDLTPGPGLAVKTVPSLQLCVQPQQRPRISFAQDWSTDKMRWKSSFWLFLIEFATPAFPRWQD